MQVSGVRFVPFQEISVDTMLIVHRFTQTSSELRIFAQLA